MGKNLDLELARSVTLVSTSKFRILRSLIDHENKTVVIYYAPIDSDGKQLETMNAEFAGIDISETEASISDLLAGKYA